MWIYSQFQPLTRLWALHWHVSGYLHLIFEITTRGCFLVYKYSAISFLVLFSFFCIDVNISWKNASPFWDMREQYTHTHVHTFHFNFPRTYIKSWKTTHRFERKPTQNVTGLYWILEESVWDKGLGRKGTYQGARIMFLNIN